MCGCREYTLFPPDPLFRSVFKLAPEFWSFCTQRHFAKTEKQNSDGFRVMTSDITAWNVLLGLIRAEDLQPCQRKG